MLTYVESAMSIQKDEQNRIILIIFDIYMYAFIILLISWNFSPSYSKFVVLIIFILNNNTCDVYFDSL